MCTIRKEYYKMSGSEWDEHGGFRAGSGERVIVNRGESKNNWCGRISKL